MTTRTSAVVPTPMRRLLLGLAALAGIAAMVGTLYDALVRGHRSGSSTVLTVVMAVIAVVALVVAVVPPRTAPGPWALRRAAEIFTVIGVVAALLLLTTVSYQPMLRSLGYNAVDPETTLVLSRPPGTEEGDLLVAQVLRQGPGPLRAPTTWTRLASTPLTADGSETVELWTHVADDDDPASFAFTTDLPGGKIGGMTSWSHAGAAAVRAEATGAGGAVTAPTLTMESDQSPLLYFVAASGGLVTAPPDGLTEGFTARADGVFKATSTLLLRAPGAGEDVDAATLAPTASGPWAVQAVELAPS